MLSKLAIIFPEASIVLIAVLGGLVHYMQRIKTGHVRFGLLTLCIEMITSGFVGSMTHLLCKYLVIDQSLTMFLVGISGHMGVRALALLEKRYTHLFGQD